MPLRMAPMVCSRMPKCSVRPYGLPGNILVWWSAGMKDGSPFIVVSLLPARSADPPHSSGSTGARALSTWPEALRVARPFSLASNAGSVSAQPSGRARADQPGVGQRLVLDREVHGGVEAEDLLGRGHLVGTQRRAVRGAGVLLVRRGPADDGPQRDERRRAPVVARCLDGVVQRLDVLGVAAGPAPANPLHVPAVGLVPGRHVLGLGDVGVVLDRDAVVVVDHHQVAELLVGRERGGLVGDALLDVAVRAEDR